MLARNLTQLEVPRLCERFNLTDGHIHRQWVGKEKYIIQRLGELFATTSREDQHRLQRDFTSAFYRLARQSGHNADVKTAICTSASMSIEIIANCLRRAGDRIALIEPCFDNIADILCRHDVPLTVVPEIFLTDPQSIPDVHFENVTGLFLVSPNNPTGRAYTRTSFEYILQVCKRLDMLLILDTSFRFYKEDDLIFDEYRLLLESGIDFLIIEDTGKTWPTQELKLSILAGRYALWKQLSDTYSDFILHVSPFSLRLLSEFIRVSESDDMCSIKYAIRKNTASLIRALSGSPLSVANEEPSSVAWVHVGDQRDNKQVVDALARSNVYVLAGDKFFWSDPRKGSKFIRISLARDPGVFQAAAIQIRVACGQL